MNNLQRVLFISSFFQHTSKERIVNVTWCRPDHTNRPTTRGIPRYDTRPIIASRASTHVRRMTHENCGTVSVCPQHWFFTFCPFLLKKINNSPTIRRCSYGNAKVFFIRDPGPGYVRAGQRDNSFKRVWVVGEIYV